MKSKNDVKLYQNNVIINQGVHGSIAGVDGSGNLNVELMHREEYPSTPSVTESIGWVFTGWSPAYNLSGTVGNNIKTETRTYTAQYAEDSNGNGIPDGQEPANPTRPGTNDRNTDTGVQAAAQTNVTAEGYNLSEIEDAEDGVATIDEDETPLSNKKLDETSAESEAAHCILHFIILLIALITAIVFMVDGSKRRRRIDDLEDEIRKLR